MSHRAKIKAGVLKVLEGGHNGNGAIVESLAVMADKIVDAFAVECDQCTGKPQHPPANLTRLDEGGALTFGMLKEVNAARCNACYHHLQTWSPTDWACAVGGESGELLNKIKKLRRLEDGPSMPYNIGVSPELLRAEILREAADLVIYTDLLMTRLGLSLGYGVVTKFNETTERYRFPAQYKLTPLGTAPTPVPAVPTDNTMLDPERAP